MGFVYIVGWGIYTQLGGAGGKRSVGHTEYYSNRGVSRQGGDRLNH